MFAIDSFRQRDSWQPIKLCLIDLLDDFSSQIAFLYVKCTLYVDSTYPKGIYHTCSIFTYLAYHTVPWL